MPVSMHRATRSVYIETQQWHIIYAPFFFTQFTLVNMTPLMCAARMGHSSVVELLLSKGADPNLRDIVSHLISGWCCVECGHLMQKGKTAYDLACQYGHQSVRDSLTAQTTTSLCDDVV